MVRNIVLGLLFVFVRKQECFQRPVSTQDPLDMDASTASESGDGEFDHVKTEAGTIAGGVFGVVVCCVLIGVAARIFFKRKRENDLEYHRKIKVLKQSTQSAGVYMDTTAQMADTVQNDNATGQEHKLLTKDGLYDGDSEDEL